LAKLYSIFGRASPATFLLPAHIFKLVNSYIMSMRQDEIINIICREIKVSPAELKTTTNKKDVLYARKLAVHYLNEMIGDAHFFAKLFCVSTNTIYRYRNNFYKELQQDRTLKFFKSECDKLLKS
jgi:hypothetical protein